jgi:hypothetical protein
VNEPKGAGEGAAGQGAKPAPPGKSGLPQPDWDSGEVLMPLLPPPVGAPQGQMHTWTHNLGSMNLLVDAKLGGPNSQGQMMWFLYAETTIALSDPNTLTLKWSLDEDVWKNYQGWFGVTGTPRLRVRIWRW